MPAEATLYQGGDVTVTTARIVAGPATFAVAQVVSVRLGGTQLRFRGPGVVPFTLGLCLAPLALVLLFGEGTAGKTMGVLLCACAGVLGVWGQVKGAAGFWHPALLRLGDGTEAPVYLPDRASALQVVAAVSEAMVRRATG
jgi:hypothetical protein